MSERQDPERRENAERLLRHLTGTATESERRELERAVLEDDELFDQLTEIESDLVDRYVGGDLDEQTTRSLASLIDASPRLQAKAETTLALGSRSAAPREAAGETGERRSPRRIAVACGIVAALVLIGWWVVQASGLRASLKTLEAENADLRAQAVELEETVSRLEASNRALARRLARLEAESGSRRH